MRKQWGMQQICIKISRYSRYKHGMPCSQSSKNGDGSKLLLNIEQAEKVIKAVVKNSTKPVTLKIRKGWDCEHIVATEFAKMAEQAGVSAITIHGRTRTEMYSGKADLDIIKRVKESVNIPVIGNGDVVDEESALKMFEYTGVDGIMIGRGTFGNPWIFARIKHFLETGEKLPEEKGLIQEYNPEIRVEQITKAIELALSLLSMSFGYGTKNTALKMDRLRRLLSISVKGRMPCRSLESSDK